MPGKPTAEAKQAYQLYAKGAAMDVACKKAGVHISTLYRWIASKKKTQKSSKSA